MSFPAVLIVSDSFLQVTISASVPFVFVITGIMGSARK